jgi:hypothetical protein
MLTEEELLEKARKVSAIDEVVTACSADKTWVTARGSRKSSYGFDVFYDPHTGFGTDKSEKSRTVTVGYDRENTSPPKMIVKIKDCPEQEYNDLCAAITLIWHNSGVYNLDFQKSNSKVDSE